MTSSLVQLNLDQNVLTEVVNTTTGSRSSSNRGKCFYRGQFVNEARKCRSPGSGASNITGTSNGG